MSVIIQNKTPVISWIFGDADGHQQKMFRVLVTTASDNNSEIVLWDTGYVQGDQTQVVYNYDGSGMELPSHETIKVLIMASDGMDWGYSSYKEFIISAKPIIKICTVDNKLNPTNLKTHKPIFRWEYTDIDNDYLISYEIRVGDTDGNIDDLGTDLYVGNVWRSEVLSLPNPHESVFNNNSQAFTGCYFPKDLEFGKIYYYQLQVKDKYDESNWYVGSFRLNIPPSASNLQVLPVEPFYHDVLKAQYDFVDDIGELESDKTQICWYKNNREVYELRNSKTVPSEKTIPRDSWYFTVRPHDGVEYGNIFISPRVVIQNNPPKVTVVGIEPKKPKNSDFLEAKFFVSDKEKNININIYWFRNGLEQPSIRNSLIVPPGFGNVNDEWYFEVQADDGYAKSNIERSEKVVIENSRPEIEYIYINGIPSPMGISSQSPKIEWGYKDIDNQDQVYYQLLIGTKPPSANTNIPGNQYMPSSPETNGIISIIDEIINGTGNDIIDTNVVNSSEKFYYRKFSQSNNEIILGPNNSSSYINYVLDFDLQTSVLQPQKESGEIYYSFPGNKGNYVISINYIGEENRKSAYKLIIDGIVIDEIISSGIIGEKTESFKQSFIDNGSQIIISGSSIENNGRAPFLQLKCYPIYDFTIFANKMILSGYVDQGDGTIGLVSTSGLAQLYFSNPSGKYDLEIHYVTESSGNSNIILKKNDDEISNWTFELGVKNRTKTIRNISINTGDKIKIISSRSGNSSAKVSKIVFIPHLPSGISIFSPGFTYYVSIRVSDGNLLSPWYVSKFTMLGSSWLSSVSNNTGWTIEFGCRIFNVS